MMMVNVVYNKICKLLMMIKMEILKIKLVKDFKWKKMSYLLLINFNNNKNNELFVI